MNQEELAEIVKRSIELRNIINDAQSELNQLNKKTSDSSITLSRINTKQQFMELFNKICESQPDYNKNSVKNLYSYCVKNNVQFALNVIQNFKKQNELRQLAFQCLFNVEIQYKYLFFNIKHLTNKEKREIYNSYRNIYFNNSKLGFELFNYCTRFKDFISFDELEKCIDALIKLKDSSQFKSLKREFDLPPHLLEKIDSYFLIQQLSV